MSKSELDLSIAFAMLELIELEHSKRSLTECPGIENVYAAIVEAKKKQNNERNPN